MSAQGYNTAVVYGLQVGDLETYRRRIADESAIARRGVRDWSPIEYHGIVIGD